MVKYSLSLVNITRDINGLIIECGAHNNDTGDEWHTFHSTELRIGEILLFH